MSEPQRVKLKIGRLSAALVAIVWVNAGSAPARAGGAVVCVNCSTIFEQLLEEATAIEHLQQSIVQTAQQIQMVAMQVRNLKNLPVQLWPNLKGELVRLVNQVGSAQGLNFALQNTLAAATEQYGAIGSELASPQTLLQQWNAALRDQITKTLQQYQLHESDFQTTQDALEQIERTEQDAAGEMQLLRAGNEIAKIAVNQTISLQSDLQAATQTVMNYLGERASEDLDAKQRYHDWMQKSMRPFVPHF